MEVSITNTRRRNDKRWKLATNVENNKRKGRYHNGKGRLRIKGRKHWDGNENEPRVEARRHDL